jgi:Cu+-exporting ATPase
MGLCGWINNRRILLGNRELMNNHKIEGIPTLTKEKEFTEGGKDALYLSVSGSLAAMFIIEITASQTIKAAMQQLEKHDMAVIIKTIDPFVTISRVSGLFNFTEELLKIIPTRMHREYDNETKKERKFSTSLACSGKFGSFVQLIMSVKSIKKTVSSGVFIQSVSALLGMGIVSMHCMLNAAAELSPLWMIIYNLICTIITTIVVGIKKV